MPVITIKGYEESDSAECVQQHQDKNDFASLSLPCSKGLCMGFAALPWTFYFNNHQQNLL